VASSLQGALALCLGEPVVFVIGGGEVYKAALPLADGLVLTEIGRDFDGDTHFPDWDRAAFKATQRQAHTAADGLPYEFVLYERLASPETLSG
jgi:dihydrofolate reductase